MTSYGSKQPLFVDLNSNISNSGQVTPGFKLWYVDKNHLKTNFYKMVHCNGANRIRGI